MSSSYVRNLARQWAATLTIPFHETINMQDSPDAPFTTLEFYNEYTEDMTFNGCGVMEYGTIDLIMFSEAGVADSMLAQFEIEIKNFMQNKDPAKKFYIIGKDIIETFDNEGEYYRTVQGFNYVYGT